jgi:hypothetical protein
MDPIEAHTHSFIVRVWLEESIEEAGRATWRGHITHVPGGERIYLEDLDRIRTFITPYVEQMGIKFSFIDNLKRRLAHWRTRSRARNRGRGDFPSPTGRLENRDE